MSHEILERLKAGELLLCDGAMGTMLIASGLKAGECPELWNRERPEAVQAIHRAYFEGGSDIVLTNTFGGTRVRLANFGLEKEVRDLNSRAVGLAKEVAPSGKWVALSVGPTGEFLEPVGNLKFEEMKEIFSEQIGAALEAGADAVCIETMGDPEESRAAIEATRALADVPIFATMTFEHGKRGYHTLMGIDPPTAAERLLAAGAHVVGSNCGNGIDEMAEIMEEMMAGRGGLFLAQANAGKPEMEGDTPVYRQGPEEYAEKSKKLKALGVNIIGGCCGTTPEHIKRMAAVLKG